MDAPVALPASVTMQEASAVLRRVEAAMPASGGQLQIDAGPLETFDTALIAVLLQALRSANARGASVRVLSAPAKLQALAALYGVDSLLPLESAATRPAST